MTFTRYVQLCWIQHGTRTQNKYKQLTPTHITTEIIQVHSSH